MNIPKEFSFVWSKIENKGKVYRGVAITLFVSAIGATVPYIYGRLVDFATKPYSSTKTLILIILLWLLISLVRDGFDRVSTKFAYQIGIDLYTKLHTEIAGHLITLPLKFHKEKKIGEVSNRINRGIEDFYSIVEETIFSFFPTIVTFFVALGILFFVEWRLTMILAAASVAYVFVTLAYTKEIVKGGKVLNKAWDKAFGDRHDALFNVETVKASTNEKFENSKNEANFNRANKIFRIYREWWLKMDAWQSFIFTLSFIAVFSIGVFMLRAGNLTTGNLIMFVGYISLLTAPLSKIANQYRKIKRGISSFRRAIDYLKIVPEKDFVNPKEIKELKGNIAFENVSFGYKKEKSVMSGISFEVKAGEAVALVGESGVGKTTLINLLGRYYLPKSGEILIDGMNIKKLRLKFLRDNMAIVPQEVLLFNDTIKNNIRYGKVSATDEEVVKVAKVANAHEFIESFPKKYNQLVGERGIKLSTGQKQRIAIARAILRNPKILILDEATSALDSASEKQIQEAFERLIKGRTTFIIAHRLSTIMKADKIIVLEKGKIVEMGTHSELIKNPDSVYRNFWELQTAIQRIK